MSHSYPLVWPTGRPRTEHPRHSVFKASLYEATNGVNYQLHLLGASNVSITSNMRLGASSQLLSRQTSEDTGIAVYFDYDGSRHVVAIDRFCAFWENMRAIEKSLEALRGLERWGGAEIVKTSLGGFKELPQTIIVTQETRRQWWDVLQVSQSADWDIIEAAYKRLLHKTHPDKGGTAHTFQEVQQAYRQAKEGKG
jgi:hypothetical protein